MQEPHIIEKDLVIIGAGPGGYSAAFRAADLGRQVTLIDQRAVLGGVCLNEGCIPSKTLLHATEIARQAQHSADYGIRFDTLSIDTLALRQHTEAVSGKLTAGLAHIARRRQVTFTQAQAQLHSQDTLLVTTTADSSQALWRFKHLIIATGSSPITLPDWPDDSRIWQAEQAVKVPELPTHLVIVGGGIIGLEMATVYNNLGCQVSVLELSGQIAGSCDPQAAQVLEKTLTARGVTIHTHTQVTQLRCLASHIEIDYQGPQAGSLNASHVLQSIGRRANTAALKLEAAGIQSNAQAQISTDASGRTNLKHIYAIGDVTGSPMLAHRAVHQGKIAAEACCGLDSQDQGSLIPSVAYTQPEVAWVGLDEQAASAAGFNGKASVFPWAANGRALAQSSEAGFSKILYDSDSQRILGATLVGDNAGELIAEITLAIELGANLEDLGHTVHPHPTRSETLAMSAELALGLCTDL